MRLNHLALTVRDQERSRSFYETYFGFGAGPAQRYDDGVVIIRDEAGFDLAIGQHGDPGEMARFLHFGFRCAGPEEARVLLERVTAGGVPVTERDDTPGYVGFKCLDPDGYTVEVYWEA